MLGRARDSCFAKQQRMAAAIRASHGEDSIQLKQAEAFGLQLAALRKVRAAKTKLQASVAALLQAETLAEALQAAVAGVEAGTECYCSHVWNASAARVRPAADCVARSCAGNHSQGCGGAYRMRPLLFMVMLLMQRSPRAEQVM